MTKRERVAAALKGEQVDRVPVTAWLHFPLKDKTAQGQVDAFVDSNENIIHRSKHGSASPGQTATFPANNSM